MEEETGIDLGGMVHRGKFTGNGIGFWLEIVLSSRLNADDSLLLFFAVDANYYTPQRNFPLTPPNF
jgi:hypothetical protein